MRLRVLGILIACALAGALPAPVAAVDPPTVASAPTLTDGIVAGVSHGTSGFGLSPVIVPVGAYVTYFVRTDPNLAGRRLQVWTRTGSAAWERVTTRIVATDGTVRYFARVRATTRFRAAWAGDETYAAATALGRAAGVSTTGETRLTVSCDEFDQARSASTGKAVVVREAWVRVGTLLTFRLCSNASTGFSWGRVAYDPTVLSLRRQWATPPAVAAPGAPGLDNSRFLTLRVATRTVSTTYSQPWAGGEKGVWTFRLIVHTFR